MARAVRVSVGGVDRAVVGGEGGGAVGAGRNNQGSSVLFSLKKQICNNLT